MSITKDIEDAATARWRDETYLPVPNPVRIGERLAYHTAFAIHKQLEQEEKENAS